MSAVANGDVWNIGSDLAQLRKTGLSTPHLFDVYGTEPKPVQGEQRAYAEIALLVLGNLLAKGTKVRSGAHFRIAGTLMLEVCTAKPCHVCNGSDPRVRKGGVCNNCYGNGFEPAPMYWRANTSDCHVRDFNERLHEIYERSLRFVVESLRAARA